LAIIPKAFVGRGTPASGPEEIPLQPASSGKTKSPLKTFRKFTGKLPSARDSHAAYRIIVDIPKRTETAAKACTEIRIETMERMVLTFHAWRRAKPTEDSEVVVNFLFSLLGEADHRAGVTPSHKQTFWTEVSLARDLAARGNWKTLSRAQKVKAMFQFAVESIQRSGRKLREAPLFWRPQSELEKGPPWDLTRGQFPKRHTITFEVEEGALAGRLKARESAGL
jgi:hypothetical protein